MGNSGHSGSICIDRVRDIVDHRAPREQVSGSLMNQLLAIKGVTSIHQISFLFCSRSKNRVTSQRLKATKMLEINILIRIINDNLAVVPHKEWLPDRRYTVVRNGSTPRSNLRDKFPGLALISTCVYIDLRIVQVRRDRIAGGEKGSSGISPYTDG